MKIAQRFSVGNALNQSKVPSGTEDFFVLPGLVRVIVLPSHKWLGYFQSGWDLLASQSERAEHPDQLPTASFMKAEAESSGKQAEFL